MGFRLALLYTSFPNLYILQRLPNFSLEDRNKRGHIFICFFLIFFELMIKSVLFFSFFLGVYYVNTNLGAKYRLLGRGGDCRGTEAGRGGSIQN